MIGREMGIKLKDFLKMHNELVEKAKVFLKGEKSLITPETVFLEPIEEISDIPCTLVNQQMTDKSMIEGIENLQKLSLLADQGNSCLILLEHYSNADYSCFYALLERMGYSEIAKKLIAIAGIKLYEDNFLVKAVIRAFRVLFVYASRSFEKLNKENESDKSEIERARQINLASLKVLMKKKVSGHIMALFPSGTRYRPWDPKTKEIIKETASYIKQFNYCVFVGINGNILRLVSENMEDDLVVEDTLIFSVSSVTDTKEYIQQLQKSINDKEQEKKIICQAVSNSLDKMHLQGKKLYDTLTKSI